MNAGAIPPTVIRSVLARPGFQVPVRAVHPLAYGIASPGPDISASVSMGLSIMVFPADITVV